MIKLAELEKRYNEINAVCDLNLPTFWGIKRDLKKTTHPLTRVACCILDGAGNAHFERKSIFTCSTLFYISSQLRSHILTAEKNKLEKEKRQMKNNEKVGDERSIIEHNHDHITITCDCGHNVKIRGYCIEGCCNNCGHIYSCDNFGCVTLAGNLYDDHF